MSFKLNKELVLKTFKKRLPIIGWLSIYDSDKFISDMIAGITVGLTVMPQALAYATLGGLEPQYGLYSAFAGGFVYAIFGSCKDIAIGPTALMALMTYQQIVNRNTDYAVLLCFLSGVAQLIMTVLHLGVLIDFISIPVTVGFTSATSVIICTSQFKSLLGLKFASSGFMDTVVKIYHHIDETRFSDFTLAICCISILISLRKMKDLRLVAKPTQNEKYLSKTLWLIATSRNALIVILSGTLAYFYQTSDGQSLFILTGNVKSGLPEPKLPPFRTELNNRTVEFVEMVSDLGSSVIMVPVIAVLGNVAIAKAFASEKGVDATQELLTLSLCNIIGSMFSSMPITGSFSRSAVNHVSGVQTPLGGLYTGAMVLLALSFLTPYFAFIPKASLGAVIICAVIFMIEYEVLRPMWRSSRKDLIPMFATFILCLGVGVELGIIIGVGINIILLLIPSARPTIIVEKMNKNGTDYILITPGNSLYFPAIDFIKNSVVKAALNSSHLPIVLDCRFILGADFTAAKGISALIKEFIKRGQPLYFLNARDEVVSVFKGIIEDFQQVSSVDEIEKFNKENGFSENSKLLAESTLQNDSRKNSIIELNEIIAFKGNGVTSTDLTHRKSNDT